jgi:hypothetical protein
LIDIRSRSVGGVSNGGTPSWSSAASACTRSRAGRPRAPVRYRSAARAQRDRREPPRSSRVSPGVFRVTRLLPRPVAGGCAGCAFGAWKAAVPAMQGSGIEFVHPWAGLRRVLQDRLHMFRAGRPRSIWSSAAPLRNGRRRASRSAIPPPAPKISSKRPQT